VGRVTALDSIVNLGKARFELKILEGNGSDAGGEPAVVPGSVKLTEAFQAPPNPDEKSRNTTPQVFGNLTVKTESMY